MHHRSSFAARIAASQRLTGSLLCVGIDPDPNRLPGSVGSGARDVATFCTEIIRHTAPFACAFKLNFAFFEALGNDGWSVLRDVLAAIPDAAVSIADAKRGDIGNSAGFYAESVFEDLGFDAVTVNPYMGADAVEPFLAYEGRAAFILAKTSNPGSNDLQTLSVDGTPLYLHVGALSQTWGGRSAGEAGLVVGATDIGAMTRLRERCPAMPFLVPGVGAQGGDARAVASAAWAGPGSLIVNSSRAILYASPGSDFAEAAGRAARSAAAALTLPE